MALWKRKQKAAKDKSMTAQQKQPMRARSGSPSLSKVKHIIAIASGKGGVGKSTVSANFAVALQKTGLKVGLMDSDIYGPSQPGMLGIGQIEPDIKDGLLVPPEKHGIKVISMGMLLGEDAPVVWRGPMATKMVQQFIGNVAWGELDYLIIDLPPGTGDVQITLAQQASLTGAIIVTTPQQVAMGVAAKGLKMFGQVNVPIVGIVENMSGFACANCGQVTDIFKKGGGKSMAEKAGVPFLGAIPLDPEIVESGESGKPVLLSGTESPSAKAFIDLAESFTEVMKEREGMADELVPSRIDFNDDGNLILEWADGVKGALSPYDLRVNCPCAACIDEDTGKRILDPKQVPLDIRINGYQPVGRYALAFDFSDRHDTGIYRFDWLRKLVANISKESFSV
jgi:ATP-binding protein involved in chromosome partitioning